MEPLHNMKAVALRTGLSPHLVRMWEKRYAAVQPGRSLTQRRLYTDEEVDRLSMLARLTRSGLNIGQIARLPTPELRSMVDRLGDLPGAPLPQGRLSTPVDAATFAERAIEAIRSYDIPSLERTLDDSMLAMGHSGMLERLLVPLLQRLGADWQRGEITAAQEHCATSAIKDYLARTLRPVNTPESAPRLLVTTPAGQLHEMGAAIAAGLARKSGWNVTYLGPSLPAEEIVGAVMMNNIRAVALSIVYPADDPDLPDQMVRLRSLLPDEVPIIIGGQAADAYSHVLSRIGALRVASMEDFTRVLLEVRDGHHATPAPQLAPRPESRRRTAAPQEKHQA
jgi:MerR family transcriptional regulator, light-induced transcriptional regulator